MSTCSDESAAPAVLTALKALSDPNRLRIVALVSERDDICALEILEELKITQPTLSHHMKTLVDCGLVESRKDGRWRKYSIHKDSVESFMQDLNGLLCPQRA